MQNAYKIFILPVCVLEKLFLSAPNLLNCVMCSINYLFYIYLFFHQGQAK